MDVMEAIKTRRSVRRFKPDPIPDDIMAEVLEAARWAPSWANTQCWEFIVVKDKETKERIAGEVLAQGNPAKRGVAEAPAVVVALAKKGLAGFYKESAVTDKGDWFMYDVGVAMQNLCLAAWGSGAWDRARGIDGRVQGRGDPRCPERDACGRTDARWATPPWWGEAPIAKKSRSSCTGKDTKRNRKGPIVPSYT